MAKMTPSEAIVETLLAESVDHVSGIVGSAFMDMLDLFPSAGYASYRCATSRLRRIWRMPGGG